jgi:uncharacterized membrane protein
MKKNKFKTTEWFWNLLGFTFIIAGTTLAVISLIGDYMAVPSNQNWVFIAENAVIDFTTLDLDFLAYGVWIVVLGSLIAVTSLVVFANREQTELDKATRRASRLAETLKDS